MKFTIEKWNRGWKYQATGEDGEVLEEGTREAFFGCAARCLEILNAYRNHAMASGISLDFSSSDKETLQSGDFDE